MRLRNFLQRFKKTFPLCEAESLPRTIRSLGFKRDFRRQPIVAAFGRDTEVRRNAVLKNLKPKDTMPGVDPAGGVMPVGMVMRMVMVRIGCKNLLPARPPQHPCAHDDDNHSGRDL